MRGKTSEGRIRVVALTKTSVLPLSNQRSQLTNPQLIYQARMKLERTILRSIPGARIQRSLSCVVKVDFPPSTRRISAIVVLVDQLASISKWKVLENMEDRWSLSEGYVRVILVCARGLS